MEGTSDKLREIARLLGQLAEEKPEPDHAADNAETITKYKIQALRDAVVSGITFVRTDGSTPSGSAAIEALDTLIRYASISLLSHGKMGAKLARRQDEVREMHERIRVLESEARASKNAAAKKLRAKASEQRQICEKSIATINKQSTDRRTRVFAAIDRYMATGVADALDEIADEIDPDGACPF